MVKAFYAVRISVRDTGIGIVPESLEKLFLPFSQADSSPTRKFGGTGLGLAIVKHYAELMGGCVGVASKLGAGSHFWADLPLCIPSGSVESPRSAFASLAAGPAIMGLRILVAEDNPINRRLLVRILARFGLLADVVDDGLQAVQAFTAAINTASPYSVILMDCQMPVMDGVEATRAIRRLEVDRKLNRVYIVALTADAIQGAAEKYIGAGMDAYISKPIDIPQVLLVCGLTFLPPLLTCGSVVVTESARIRSVGARNIAAGNNPRRDGR